MSLLLFWQQTGTPPVTGTVAATDAPDSVAAQARLAFLVTSTLTDATDAVAASGAEEFRSTTNATDAIDAASGQALEALRGTAGPADNTDGIAAGGFTPPPVQLGGGGLNFGTYRPDLRPKPKPRSIPRVSAEVHLADTPDGAAAIGSALDDSDALLVLMH